MVVRCGVVGGVFIVLSAIFLVLTLYALRQILKYRPKLYYNPHNWHRYLKKKKKKPQIATPVIAAAWDKVQAKLKDPSPDSLRLAVIEADGVVDEALKRMGLEGETFADRLGRVKSDQYPSLDKVWDAHRLRNNLVHTPDFEVTAAKAEESIAAYEAFLKELKAL